MPTPGLPTCTRCGHAVTGIRSYANMLRPVCLTCHPRYARPANGHKAATAANRRAVLARVATSPDVLPTKEPTFRPPKPPRVVIVKREAPPPPPPPIVAAPPADTHVLSLRERLRARRAAEHAAQESSPS